MSTAGGIRAKRSVIRCAGVLAAARGHHVGPTTRSTRGALVEAGDVGLGPSTLFTASRRLGARAPRRIVAQAPQIGGYFCDATTAFVRPRSDIMHACKRTAWNEAPRSGSIGLGGEHSRKRLLWASAMVYWSVMAQWRFPGTGEIPNGRVTPRIAEQPPLEVATSAQPSYRMHHHAARLAQALLLTAEVLVLAEDDRPARAHALARRMFDADWRGRCALWNDFEAACEAARQAAPTLAEAACAVAWAAAVSARGVSKLVDLNYDEAGRLADVAIDHVHAAHRLACLPCSECTERDARNTAQREASEREVREVAARAVQRHAAAERTAAQREAVERAAAEREATQRAHALREAAEREAAEREATQRAQAECETAEREEAELSLLEAEIAKLDAEEAVQREMTRVREAAELAALQTELAELEARESAEREAAEREAEQRAVAQREAAQREAAEREAAPAAPSQRRRKATATAVELAAPRSQRRRATTAAGMVHPWYCTCGCPATERDWTVDRPDLANSEERPGRR